jgi:hypothetical protein
MAETHADEKAGFTVSSSTCKRYFGYLSQREKGAGMPDECLTCDKMIDCMFSKPENPPATTETKPELEVPETAEEEPVTEDEETEPTETFEEPVIDYEPETLEAEAEVEEAEESTLSLKPPKPVEPERPTAKPIAKKSEGNFIVESPGHLYNQWSSTVLINKETLESFGKKVKEVYVQTQEGIRVKCKVHAISDIGPRTIQIPNKVKADLEIENGAYVKVTPK